MSMRESIQAQHCPSLYRLFCAFNVPRAKDDTTCQLLFQVLASLPCAWLSRQTWWAVPFVILIPSLLASRTTSERRSS